MSKSLIKIGTHNFRRDMIIVERIADLAISSVDLQDPSEKIEIRAVLYIVDYADVQWLKNTRERPSRKRVNVLFNLGTDQILYRKSKNQLAELIGVNNKDEVMQHVKDSIGSLCH